MLGRPTRGFSILEILVATFLATLVLGVLLSVFVFGRRVWQSTESSYLLSRELALAMTTMRQELQETNIGSIRSQKEPPGCSMATVRDPSNNQISLLPSGAPGWWGYIYYALAPEGDRANLIRWVRRNNRPVVLPWPSTVAPWPIQGEVEKRVALRNVLPVGRSLVKRKDRWEPAPDASSQGGFALRFVRSGPDGRVLSLDNPTTFSDSDRPKWSLGNTPLVQVDLKIAERSSESGRYNYVEFHLKAIPRN